MNPLLINEHKSDCKGHKKIPWAFLPDKKSYIHKVLRNTQKYKGNKSGRPHQKGHYTWYQIICNDPSCPAIIRVPEEWLLIQIQNYFNILPESESDIRMRIWIPYSLKYGLSTDMAICEEIEKEKYVLNAGFEWIEFVAMSDPLDRKQDFLDQFNPVKEALTRTGGDPEWCKCGQVKGHDNGEECIS